MRRGNEEGDWEIVDLGIVDWGKVDREIVVDWEKIDPEIGRLVDRKIWEMGDWGKGD